MFALRNTSVNTNVILLQSNAWANGQVRCSVAELCIDMSGMEEKRIRYTPSLSLNSRESNVSWLLKECFTWLCLAPHLNLHFGNEDISYFQAVLGNRPNGHVPICDAEVPFQDLVS